MQRPMTECGSSYKLFFMNNGSRMMMVMGVIRMMEMVIWLFQKLSPIAVASLVSFHIITSFLKGLGLNFTVSKGL